MNLDTKSMDTVERNEEATINKSEHFGRRVSWHSWGSMSTRESMRTCPSMRSSSKHWRERKNFLRSGPIQWSVSFNTDLDWDYSTVRTRWRKLRLLLHPVKIVAFSWDIEDLTVSIQRVVECRTEVPPPDTCPGCRYGGAQPLIWQSTLSDHHLHWCSFAQARNPETIDNLVSDYNSPTWIWQSTLSLCTSSKSTDNGQPCLWLQQPSLRKHNSPTSLQAAQRPLDAHTTLD